MKLNHKEKIEILKNLIHTYEVESNELDEMIMCWNERDDIFSGPHEQEKQENKCKLSYQKIVEFVKQNN